MRSLAARTPPNAIFATIWRKSPPHFLLKTGLGCEIPWDGSANPWDGNRNPWDGSTGQPHGRTKITLKGGATRASALTVCHIAHKPTRPGNSTPTRRLEATLGGTPSWRPTPPGWPTAGEAYRGGAAPDRGWTPGWRPSYGKLPCPRPQRAFLSAACGMFVKKVVPLHAVYRFLFYTANSHRETCP